MFETFSYLSLQQYWWLIVSLLGALFVFLSFVQGGGTLLFTIAKNENEKRLLINTLGRKWEFTFTTLVTFGGAFFASFPLFYSSSFGGAYWVWFIILISFVIQAVSYEFRKKPGNFLGAKTYEVFLFINGLIGPILIGIAVGTFFNGANFSLDDMNRVSWANSTRGLEAALNFHNLSLGLAVFFLARVLGLLYFINSVDNQTIFVRSVKHLLYNSVLFLLFFLIFLVWLFLKDGYAYNPETGIVSLQDFKYFKNLVAMPLNTIMLLLGIAGVLYGIYNTLAKRGTKGIWFSGSGTVISVWAIFILAGFNNTCFYPSLFDLQSSLTIENSSSSKFTLVVMSYVSLLVPFVFAYIWYAWKAISNKKISDAELDNEHHVY